jgi:hypothetical protein
MHILPTEMLKRKGKREAQSEGGKDVRLLGMQHSYGRPDRNGHTNITLRGPCAIGDEVDLLSQRKKGVW